MLLPVLVSASDDEFQIEQLDADDVAAYISSLEK